MEYVPLCEPWPLPPSGCPDLTSSPAVTGYAVTAASEVLWELSGRQYGSCEVTIRPCRPACPTANPFPANWWRSGWQWPMWPAIGASMWATAVCGRCPTSGCGCNEADTLTLPAPARQVTGVVVDGVAVPEGTGWNLFNGTLLVRADGERWPMCQDWTVPVSGVGAWSITAIYGQPVPMIGQLAVGALAAEIAAGCDGGPCKLPAYTKSVGRQGVTQEFKTAVEIAAAGIVGVGIPLVDLFLQTANPGNLRHRPMLYNPDEVLARTRPRIPGGS